VRSQRPIKGFRPGKEPAHLKKRRAKARLRGDADLAGLSELESYQFLAYYRAYWLHFQNVFFQQNLGVLESGVWDTYARILCTDYRGLPGVRATWPDHAPVLEPDFVGFVESCPPA